MSGNAPRKSKTTSAASRSSSSSSSMQFPVSPPYSSVSSAGSKAPASIEFPTSPQPATACGEEITHYSHPKHPLAQITLPELFVCGGCKEYGAGKRYTCQQCDYQLHEFCALSPPALRGHPLHGQHQLVFHSRPKQAGILWPKCDICGKSTKGFTFRCRACGFQMHPCCAMLSNEMIFPGGHPHKLKLLPPGQAINGDNGTAAGELVCGECKRKRSRGRVYRCTVCDNYQLHAVCGKAMINGLQANGIKTPKSSNSNMLGTAARLASQVVIEFIGGLIEGFGEGVGEALVQNIARGRRQTNINSLAGARTVA